VIFPTSITGAYTYARAGEVDAPAATWMASLGLVGAALGAFATEWVDPAVLLLVTAALLGWQSIGIMRGPKRGRTDAVRPAVTTPAAYAAIGGAAGLISGLLGIGGGLVMVPLLSGWCGMPLKRALVAGQHRLAARAVPDDRSGPGRARGRDDRAGHTRPDAPTSGWRRDAGDRGPVRRAAAPSAAALSGAHTSRRLRCGA
jgi:hypothetical protein